MSRPVKHYIFDPGFPEIVVTSATPVPRVATFGGTIIPKRRAKSQDPGLLRVPNGDKKARDPRALQGLLRRSPSTPSLAQKYAAKAPWVPEGKGPARLDLSLWRSKKNGLPTKIVTAQHVSTAATTPKQTIVTPRPPPPEIPTVFIDMNINAISKAHGRRVGNGKVNRESRRMQNDIDLEVTTDKASMTAEEDAATYPSIDTLVD